MKKANRLYVSGEGETLLFHSAGSFEELKKKLTAEQAQTVRSPNPDELRELWKRKNLYPLTNEQIASQFNVSRQAVCMWRRKAGIKEEFEHIKRRRERMEEIKKHLSPDKSLSEIARETGAPLAAVRKAAQKAGVTLAMKSQKRPSDAAIVKLAVGKTWRELAQACGVELSSLRSYVYSRPDLAERIRKKLVRSPAGSQAHKKIDVDQLVTLRRGGLSAYQIAKHFGVETPSVQYWVRKLQLDKM